MARESATPPGRICLGQIGGIDQEKLMQAMVQTWNKLDLKK